MADENAMEIAVKNEDLLEVAALLSRNVKPTRDDFIYAIKEKSFSILELFLKDGYNINEPFRPDYPPPLAFAFFDSDLTKWLLQQGADLNARCHFDITPLSIAAQTAPLEILELLFEFGASVHVGQPLHYAVRFQRPNDVIKLFIDKGAPLNNVLFQNDKVSYYHFESLGLGTPLHEAAHQNNDRIIGVLLQNGADLNVRDSLGKLPALDLRSLLRQGYHPPTSQIRTISTCRD